jgi:hypothetical protein
MANMFWGADEFNQDIGDWDVKNLDNKYGLYGIFYQAKSFNQDLSNWCVAQFSSEPGRFSNFSPLVNSNKPKWGTCPD